MLQRKWKWSNSELRRWAMHTRPEAPHALIQEVCLAAGLAGIEGFATLFECEDLPALERIAAGYREKHLAIPTFHLPFNGPDTDIASLYETQRRRAVDTSLHWMERAAALGTTVVIQHPVFQTFHVDVEGFDRLLRALDRSLQTLLSRAEALGLTIAIENMTPGPDRGRFASQPEHFERFNSEFNHPSLGYCLDTGHALYACHERAAEMLDVMSPRLVAFHLVDNAGDRDSHLAPGRGRVDWPRVFRRMAEIDFRGVACIEAPPFDFGPDYAPQAFVELVRETSALADRTLGE